MGAVAIIGFYDLFGAQFVPDTLILPRIFEIPSRIGWPWQTWMVVLLVALLILVFEGAHHHIKSFEQDRLERIHVVLWSFGSYLLPESGLINPKRGVYSLHIAVTNQSNSPLGIARFVLGESGETRLPIDPVPADRVKEFTVFGVARPFRDLESMPHNFYLRPKESKTGQLIFVHDEIMEKPKLCITGGEGIIWTMDIHGKLSPKVGKPRAVETRELC